MIGFRVSESRPRHELNRISIIFLLLESMKPQRNEMVSRNVIISQSFDSLSRRAFVRKLIDETKLKQHRLGNRVVV